jgi:hypothetical protein
VGLVQREMEAAGLATITLSTIAAFTASVGAPRVAAIEYPQGRPLGQPGDAQGQLAVLRETLAALGRIERPGAVVDLPFEWPEPPREVRSRPRESPPIAKLLKRRPWLYPRLLAGDFPE